MKTWAKTAIPAILIAGIIGFIGWRIVAGNQAKPIKTITAQYQTVVKDITFTGYTEPIQSADVAFETSGTVKDVSVQVGDIVKKGQQLASLDPQSASLQIAKAQADKASAASIAYTAWQNASQTQKDTASENTKLIAAKKQAVRDAKAVLDAATNVYTQKKSETESDDSATLTTYSTVISSKSAYNTAQTALTTALKTVQTSNNAAKHATDAAYTQYINTQQAAKDATGLSSLDALTQLAQATAAKNILRAPFAGVVTQKIITAGEFASIGNPVLTVAQTSDLQISSDVPETDALTLANNMRASVTFDALSSEQPITATITQIYPAAKAIQGVPTFHVVLRIDEQQPNIRPGITANITVHADKREHVIAIPRRAVTTKSGKTYVTKQTAPGETTEVEVTTGLIGSEGLEEITSGIKEGDTLVNP
ncbi:MAG: hypothetical protein A3E36_02840 [Candidatus Andersenbacteria bacterium RIFCSPHIGHO2_12_FULL_45_11b]|uniref:Uncharacterized protein n=1 Tax=Candidatus Andersenbacteria bacterium RIFCSPHIGHO2_12_FULL_45_11b TaxID=1797282 RepID=A0A1G1XB88_9BACT|nr:MAG: hypothetical protein A3E36_02840 [Candidatus Andersenbacteria bacterium RIFCSPHIGHO2_12_FULL_45_11b]